jgi:chemotaxis protein MotB
VPKKHVCPEPEPDLSKAWLDSYADAMTLLLAFFILLFAFSLVDQKKFQEFKAGVHLAAGKAAPTLDGGNGILDLGTGISAQVVTPPILIDGEKADDTPPPEEEDLEEGLGEVGEGEAPELYELLQDRIDAIGAGEFVQLERNERGVVVRMDSKVLYQSGSAQILPDGVTILNSIAPVIDAVDNSLVIEGHTDSQPTNGGGGFATNWELSTARAVSVLRYMNEFMEIPAARLAASGHADTRPRATNTTEEGRAENRRVELVVLVEDGDIDIIERLGEGVDDTANAEAEDGDESASDDPATGDEADGSAADADPDGAADQPTDDGAGGEAEEPEIVDIDPNIEPFPTSG